MTAEARKDTRPAWDKNTPGYDKPVTRTHPWLGAEVLRHAELRADMRFLDVAAGSSALGIPTARLGARVLATDQSPVMLELLRARARQERLNLDTRVMDGHVLELDDNSFDVAESQVGVMQLIKSRVRGRRTWPGSVPIRTYYERRLLHSQSWESPRTRFSEPSSGMHVPGVGREDFGAECRLQARTSERHYARHHEPYAEYLPLSVTKVRSTRSAVLRTWDPGT